MKALNTLLGYQPFSPYESFSSSSDRGKINLLNIFTNTSGKADVNRTRFFYEGVRTSIIYTDLHFVSCKDFKWNTVTKKLLDLVASYNSFNVVDSPIYHR